MTSMEDFFAADPKDQRQKVYADAENIQTYPLAEANRLYDQICFLLKREHLCLREYKMLYDGACERFEDCVKEMRERRQRKDHSQSRALVHDRQQAIRDAEDYKRQRNVTLDRIHRLERLEEHVYIYTRWTRVRPNEHPAW